MARQWIKLDVNFWYDDKVVAAGTFAAVLYLQAITLAQRLDSTDGTLSVEQLEMLPHHDLGDLVELVERCVDVGLLERTDRRTGASRRDVRAIAWPDWSGSTTSDKGLTEGAQRSRKYRAKRRQEGDKLPLDVAPGQIDASRAIARDIAPATLEREKEREIERESAHARARARDPLPKDQDPEEHAPEPEPSEPERPVAERLFAAWGWRVDADECDQLAEWARMRRIPDDDLLACAAVCPWPSDVRSELRDYEPRVVPAFTYDPDADNQARADADAERNDPSMREKVADVIALTRNRLTESPDDIAAKQAAARAELAAIPDDESEPW